MPLMNHERQTKDGRIYFSGNGVTTFPATFTADEVQCFSRDNHCLARLDCGTSWRYFDKGVEVRNLGTWIAKEDLAYNLWCNGMKRDEAERRAPSILREQGKDPDEILYYIRKPLERGKP